MSFIEFPYRLLVLLFASCSMARCQEFILETYCWNHDFRLDCSWNSALAIHEAYFTNDEHYVNKSLCSNIRDEREPCKEDLRPSINARCSGMSHCHFNFTQDHPERECRCKGVIVLRYSCVPESKINKFCNIKVSGSSGYISSPGYPRFYPKVSNCSWTLESSLHQEMQLTILDMDLRPGIRTRGKVLCPDALVVAENGHKVRNECGQPTSHTRIPIYTSGGRVSVQFRSNEFLPSRGFLLYFKFNGCQKLPPPRLGYLVYSNNRSALYMCCKGHVFNESLTNSLLLQCIDGTYWNSTVSPCLPVDEAIRLRNNNTATVEIPPDTDVVEMYIKKHKYIEEILIPVACVVGLVFGNAAIILLIQRIRKKRKANNSQHNGRTSILHSSSKKQIPQTLRIPVNVPLESTIPPVSATPPPPVQTAQVVRLAPRVLMTDL